MKLFFSHSLTTYNSSVEDNCLSLLQAKYPNHHVVNPKYIEITEPINTPEDFARIIEDYILPIVKSCNILAYYKDDSFSPGVDMEIAEAQRLAIPIVRLEI